MMTNARSNTVNDRVGMLTIVFGLLLGRFMMVRPNRIENGPLLNLTATFGSKGLLLVAAFSMLGILVIGIHRGKERLRPLYLPVVLFDFVLFVLMTGISANGHLNDLGSSARASLGLSFWLVVAGLTLMIMEAVNTHGNPLLARFIALITIVAVVWIGYSTGILGGISILKEFNSKSDRIAGEMIRHLQLALLSTFTGLIISMALSYRAYREPRTEGMIKNFVNMAQVIPTLSFLGLVMIPLTALSNRFPVLKAMGISGIGFYPAFIVLTMYTLLPMTNTILAGFKSIDGHVLQAASGMGMSTRQKFFLVELPLAIPSVFAGFRTALVQAVGNTILAGLVGGGGMGAILFLGLAQSAPDLVAVSALLVVAIATILNILLSLIEPLLRKRFTGEVTYD